MSKFHITSLLRPRVTYTITQQQSPVITTTANGNPKTPSPNTSTNRKTQHVVNNEICTNTVELIETLEVVSTTSISTYRTLSQECLATCLENEKNPEQQSDEIISTQTSTVNNTATVEGTSNGRQRKEQGEVRSLSSLSSSSLLGTSELLQQEGELLSPTNTPSVTIYFEESTSSISLGIMENTETKKSFSEQRSTMDHTLDSTITNNNVTIVTSSTTTTASQNNVSQRIIIKPSLNQTADSEEEEEIEEDIEEVGESSEGQEFSISLPGPSKQPRADNLFGIELSGSSSEDLQAKEQMNQSKSLKTTSDDDQFKIDDEQLSGGKLAQHFITEIEDSEMSEVGRSVHSQHETNNSFETSAHHEEEEEEEVESLTNQSTADDVSELREEEKDDSEVLSGSNNDNKAKKHTNPVMLEVSGQDTLGSKKSKDSNESLMLGAQWKSDSLNEEKEKTVERFKNPNIKPLSAASSIQSEKDHSIEEIMASNQSIEMASDETIQNPLNQNLDVISESFSNDVLNETQQLLEEQRATETTRLSIGEPVLSSTRLQDNNFDGFDSLKRKSYRNEVTLNLVNDNSFESSQKLQETTTISITSNEQLAQENSPKSLQTKIITDLDESLQESGEDAITCKRAEKVIQYNLVKSLSSKEHDAADTTLQISTAEDDEENSLQLMKLRIMAMKMEDKGNNLQLSPTGETAGTVENSQTKAMEKVPLVDFDKDQLEDITEESERNSFSTQEGHNSLVHDKSATLSTKHDSKATPNNNNDITNSTACLNMIQTLEQRVLELQQMLANKDACLATLNLQLENMNKRDAQNNQNSSELLVSGRDSISLLTNSTEYITFHEDMGQPTMDIYTELSKRDELITNLNNSLQQSLTIRENLQVEIEKLTQEVVLLRKQLTEAVESYKSTLWPPDQESNCGQRISEISMDLRSESDDDLDRIYCTDNEDKISRNSRERQLSMPRQNEYNANDNETPYDSTPFSKQIEQFQKYLTPNEVRLFFMVQKKFDDYLCRELEKCKMKYEQELKIVMDQWDTEKEEKNKEIQYFIQQRQEREAKHNQEMEDLRKYFETKCADFEKQFSDDVFSQKSQHHDMTSSSECSDQEELPEDSRMKSKETSPRKRSKAKLLLSPSHRQMTPGSDALNEDSNTNQAAQLALEITELKTFYQNKIHEIQRFQNENIKKLSDRLKYYESRYPEDEFMQSTTTTTTTTQNSTLNSTIEESTTATSQSEQVTQIGVNSPKQTPDRNAPNEHSKVGASPEVSPSVGNKNNENTSLIIIDQDEFSDNNEAQVIQKIIDEYETRLQEQLALARKDIVHELEQQIQTLLSESTTDDQHWPKELILLREKFTAKSQLEIAQLQMKHANEMSRLKQEYDKQLNRKNKRHSTFDSIRDFDKLLKERDSLRELSKTFRQVLSELLKYLTNWQTDLNENLAEEVQRLLAGNRNLDEHSFGNFNPNCSFITNETLNTSKLGRIPDVHNLLEVVENPTLVQYVTEENSDNTEDFDLKDCLERLRSEASYLLHLSEEVMKKHEGKVPYENNSSDQEKNDSEQEDGLKIKQSRVFIRVNSLNEQQLPTHQSSVVQHTQDLSSLPPDLNKYFLDSSSSTTNNGSELNFQLVDLKNRLVKSEKDRVRLQQELDYTISRNSELGKELQHLRDQLSQLSSLTNTEYNEGYGLGGAIKTPTGSKQLEPTSCNFVLLQEKARNLLSSPTQKQQNNDSTIQLLQMIEDFCREGDKVVECSKKDREDLKSQIIMADKQLKATRQFLEEQAAEREQERDEFIKEIENLKAQLREKDKERSSYVNASEEVDRLETHIRELNQKLQDSTAKRDKFEVELKASIDKIFVLREIISDLETQVETKALNEHVLNEKVKELEKYINTQSRSNESLHGQIQSLQTEIEENYQARIHQLEEKLQNVRPSAEQSIIMDQVVEQLRDIENTLDQKTKNLESLHSNTNSCSLSVTEDVSVHGATHGATQTLSSAIVTSPQGSPEHPSPRQHSLTMEAVQRVVEKLSKHSRVEEAAVKRIRDLEMQIQQMRATCVELQHERESLQERMSEQTQRISALQSRLEEQRQRAEELQRSNTTDLNIRIHDLQNELQNARETLTNREKQNATLKQQLEKSKVAIDRLEAELAVEHQPDLSALERLENELKQKQAENQKLKDKIKNEMINKLALPDLMETMLADKNEEIDHLKEQLEAKERELQTLLNASQASSAESAKKPEDASTKLSGRTLSDIVSISEFDEPDVVRRAAANNMNSPLLLPDGSGGFLQNTMETSKEVAANLTYKRTEDLSGFPNLKQVNTFEHPHYFQDPNVLLNSIQSGASITPVLVPRQINFSALTEDSKLKTPDNYQTPDNKNTPATGQTKEDLEQEIKQLKDKILELEKEKEKSADYVLSSQLRLTKLQEELANYQKEILSLQSDIKKYKIVQQELTEKSLEIENLLREQDKWKKEKTELLSKNEKNLRNYEESEENLMKRLREMEEKMLKNTENEMKERDNLRKELQAVSESHAKCKYVQRDNEDRKKQIELLNEEIKAKDERLLKLTTKVSIAEDTITMLQIQITCLEKDVEKLKQQNSDSSKQYSVDEIAKQVEKELNYSAQLDSNILKAIESEEENNLNNCNEEKTLVNEQLGTTDDENFAAERDLLNRLEALRAQINVEREHAEKLRQELLMEKQFSKDIQEQDVVLIEALRKRLESALEQENELHKELDIEKEKCERLNTQLASLRRTESRRNSFLKSPSTDSPRKSLRSVADYESDLVDRLRSEIKLLTAQNERERERSADLQKNNEREKSRFEKELNERIAYCEKLQREMDKVTRDKENAELEKDHLQERLTLQTQEIESLEQRIASFQEAETRRCARKDKQQKEYVKLGAEVVNLRAKVLHLKDDKESLNRTISQLRADVERSAKREANLAESLANTNAKLAMLEGQAAIPEKYLIKMKEINALLAENTQENKQMAETVQHLVEERVQLQQKCEELEAQLNGTTNVCELKERVNHLLARYIRSESYRKALIYQKRYLRICLQKYQYKEESDLLDAMGGVMMVPKRSTKKLFKVVAIVIISIHRMKFIRHMWQSGKRIVSKSVFILKEQECVKAPAINCKIRTSKSPAALRANEQHCQSKKSPSNPSPSLFVENNYVALKTPNLLNYNRTLNCTASSSSSSAGTVFEWPSTCGCARKKNK